jgi:Zn-dependent peptidase ImmA (M78 family)/DNA-binding XRE family transcriptional regulator
VPQQLIDIDLRVLGIRLQEARKARGLTQQDAAESLGVARTTMTAIEKGERSLQSDELLQLAVLYGRPLHDLLRQREPLIDFTVQFRSSLQQQGLEAPETASVIAELQQLGDDYLELEALRNAPLPHRYPTPYDVSGIFAERAAEDVATAERNRLGLGDGPIPNLREVLENDVGLRIFTLKMPPKIAALFGYSDRVGGCIALNSGHPEPKQRWSLAHEYAHFLTRRYQAEVTVLAAYRRVPESERFADTFSRFLLMPAAGLSRRFNEIKQARQGATTPADLVKLASFYLVAFEALVRHLEALRLLPFGTYQDLIDRGFRVREAERLLELPPPTTSSEQLPLRYQLLAAEAFQKEQITEGQFARFVRLDRLAARELYLTLQQHLDLSDEGDLNQFGLDLGEPITASRA